MHISMQLGRVTFDLQSVKVGMVVTLHFHFLTFSFYISTYAQQCITYLSLDYMIIFLGLETENNISLSVFSQLISLSLYISFKIEMTHHIAGNCFNLNEPILSSLANYSFVSCKCVLHQTLVISTFILDHTNNNLNLICTLRTFFLPQFVFIPSIDHKQPYSIQPWFTES